MALPAKTTDEIQAYQKAVKMAKYYLWPFKKRTMKDVAEHFGCSTSTVGRYFKFILPRCNPRLATKVQSKAFKVKMERQIAFTQMVKK